MQTLLHRQDLYRAIYADELVDPDSMNIRQPHTQEDVNEMLSEMKAMGMILDDEVERI